MRNRKNTHMLIGHLRILFLFVLLGMLTVPLTEAATLGGTGSGWSEPIDSTNLIAGAGADLEGTYNSATNLTRLSITSAADWTVWVRRADTIWDTANLALNVIRVNDGTGTGIITSPAAGTPITVTTSDTVFFSGNGSVSGIRVQYQLTGMSLQTLPNNYNTLVTFSITGP